MHYPIKTPFPIIAAVVSAAISACSTSGLHDSVLEEEQAQVASPVPAPERVRLEKMARHDKAMAKRQMQSPHGFTRMMPMIAEDMMMPVMPETNTENYHAFDDNRVAVVAKNPVSTFSVDVDTGAYANVRRFLHHGQQPPKDAVRVEELINYFDYDYTVPKHQGTPFAVHTEVAPSPWRDGAHLMHIGIKGFEPEKAALPNANLVFLLDVSGSMNSPDKLGLLKSSLRLLTKQLRENDRVSIAVYAGAAGVVLEPTSGQDKKAIERALNALQAGGSTNGGEGIELAYHLAEKSFIEGGINRVILATDGDFNVGTTSFDDLTALIEQKRKSGIALTTLGLGTGNYNDHLMEQLADAGNGNYAYIDTMGEAQKVLVDEMQSTLLTIAKDVKVQVEFNPQVVSEYRLIGYENRVLKNEDFNNDKVDAGDIGAGHTVTALYEVVLTNSQHPHNDPLRYAASKDVPSIDPINKNELAFLKLRYKHPDQDRSQRIQQPVKVSDMVSAFEKATPQFRFAAAVAAYGQRLRHATTIDSSFDDIRQWAMAAKGDDPYGYRGEFIQLLGLAKGLSPAS